MPAEAVAWLGKLGQPLNPDWGPRLFLDEAYDGRLAAKLTIGPTPDHRRGQSAHEVPHRLSWLWCWLPPYIPHSSSFTNQISE